MLRRKIDSYLQDWRISKNKAALLLKGARQVGKTTSVRQFGKLFYKNFVEINFIKSPQARDAFNGNLDARTIILYLSAMGYGPFVDGQTLVFFDEIQVCPNARTAIKFLVEDGRYDYIESGSMLGLNYKDILSYPVGFEQQIDMYPLDFEEFLWAKGLKQEVIEVIRNSYETLSPVPEFIHEQIMKHFREYLIVGGMPEAVTAFLASDDLTKTIQIQTNILNSYRDDIALYASRDKEKVKAIFDSIPEQLNKKNKRFILASLDDNASNRKYEQATLWLSDAGIVYHCFNTSAIELPLIMSEKRNLYKIYMVDTGLLCAMTMDGIQSKLLSGDININEGAVTENAIAAELAKHGKPLYYYDKKSRMELDFLIKEDNLVSIIEVKSGNEYRKHTALNNAYSQYKDKINRMIVLCKGNVEINDDKIIYMPLYMSLLL